MPTPMAAMMVTFQSIDFSSSVRRDAGPALPLFAGRLAVVLTETTDHEGRGVPRQNLRGPRLEAAFELCDLARPLPFRRQRPLPQPDQGRGRPIRLEAQLVPLAVLVGGGAGDGRHLPRDEASDLAAGACRHLDQR